MLPGFTAETTLGRVHSYRAFARTPVPARGTRVFPQDRQIVGDPAAVGDIGQPPDAPVQTCSCPCCITWNGKLNCC
jgi:hypothetical protein